MINILYKEDIIESFFDKYNVFDNMIEGVQVIDHDWRYFYANDSLARQGLTTKAKMLGQTMMSIYPGIEDTAIFESLRRCMEYRIAIETQTEFNFPDGSKGWFELSIQPVPEGIIVLSSDITKLKSAEAELKKKLTERTEILSQISKQKKQLEEFCQIIAHNLRAPLSNLSLLSDMVKESKSTKDKLHYMEIQKPVIDMLHNTFEELINATQVRMDYTIKRNLVDLQKRTKKIILQFEDEIIASNTTLTYDFSEANVLFYPKKYIDSIIKNLLSNALRYKSLERNPKIHIRSYKSNGWLYIDVKDNGLGIDLKKHKDNLFKLHKTFHNHPKAKGFGLFITKVQVEAMGGNISVKSIPDKGSIFTIKLYEMSTDEKIDKICLIDDDMIYRYLTQKVITETHLVKRINSFSNGLDAINFLKAEHLHEEKLPDLILLDLFMPIMDGWGFLKEYVKLLPDLPREIPIYIVSSSIDPADIQKSKAISSVTGYVIKPMTKEGFLHILENHITKNSSRWN